MGAHSGGGRLVKTDYGDLVGGTSYILFRRECAIPRNSNLPGKAIEVETDIMRGSERSFGNGETAVVDPKIGGLAGDDLTHDATAEGAIM